MWADDGRSTAVPARSVPLHSVLKNLWYCGSMDAHSYVEANHWPSRRHASRHVIPFATSCEDVDWELGFVSEDLESCRYITCRNAIGFGEDTR